MKRKPITKEALIREANRLRNACWLAMQKRGHVPLGGILSDVVIAAPFEREQWLWVAGEFLAIQSPVNPREPEKGSEG